jgi:ABC-type oligopeptide transport system substrate-binding subunit
MLHSFDYIGILKSVFGDVQRPSIGIMSAELPCWKQRDYTYKYDVAMAKDFLAKSKYGTAQNVPKMQLATQFVDQAFPEFQAIIEQWRTNLGLRVELVKDKGYGVPNPEQQYDMTIWSIGAIIPDPVTFLTNALLFKDGTNWTKSHFENADIRSLLQQAGNLFPDDPKRCDLVQQAEQIFLDNYAGMGVERVTYEYWVKPWVTGWQNNVDLSPYTLPQIYIAEH